MKEIYIFPINKDNFIKAKQKREQEKPLNYHWLEPQEG